jgi:hypothetical protein
MPAKRNLIKTDPNAIALAGWMGAENGNYFYATHIGFPKGCYRSCKIKWMQGYINGIYK